LRRAVLGGLRAEAHRLVGVEHAGDELAGEHVWVVAAHDELEPPLIGDDGAGEPCLPVKLFQASLGFSRCWAAELLVFVVLNHSQQPLAALQGLLGLDFGAESRRGGAGITFEHLDALMTVLDGTGDDPAGAASDEPGERAAELAGG
jgi:hypothetical protein